MHIATLSSKYQLCIPKAVREALHLKSGQQFICVIKNHGMQLIPKRCPKEFKGIMAGANPKNYRDRKDRV